MIHHSPLTIFQPSLYSLYTKLRNLFPLWVSALAVRMPKMLSALIFMEPVSTSNPASWIFLLLEEAFHEHLISFIFLSDKCLPTFYCLWFVFPLLNINSMRSGIMSIWSLIYSHILQKCLVHKMFKKYCCMKSEQRLCEGQWHLSRSIIMTETKH